jgi:hypothetical protein
MEELIAEKALAESRIRHFENQRDAATEIINMYKRQVKQLERAMTMLEVKSDAETLKEVAEGLK